MRADTYSSIGLCLGLMASGCASLADGGPRTASPVLAEAGRGPAARAPEPTARQWLEIADVLARSGDTVRAGQYLGMARARGAPEREVLARQLRLYAADGQYRLAIEHAESYLRRHPGEVVVRRCLASFHAAVGADADAIREYTRVVATTPADAEAHFALAALLHDAGLERARSDHHYRTYLALAPEGGHADEARAGLLKDVP